MPRLPRVCGCDWRTVRKYLAEDSPSVPPSAPSRAGTQPRVITPFIGVIESWLRNATAGQGLEPLSSLLARRSADITIAARPLADYDTAGGIR